ncbi:MAG: response regulator transcription factor [Planctomycetota bacterium]
MSQRSVLVVEDDPAIRRGLVDALAAVGHAVQEAADGKLALSIALANTFDLLLLDVMLPGLSGFAVLEEVRRFKPTLPVIMVTARGSENDRVQGLETGADDYVVKPFSARELLARVEAVLRRAGARHASALSLRGEGVAIDLARREVRLDDGSLRQLSEKEAAIVAYLASCRDRPVSREELLQNVWGLDPRGLDTRTVDMHVVRLREKLFDRADEPRIVLTVRSKGYMLSQAMVIA